MAVHRISKGLDVPLAGACKDEWGFPGRFDPGTDDLYFSQAMAVAYRLPFSSNTSSTLTLGLSSLPYHWTAELAICVLID